MQQRHLGSLLTEKTFYIAKVLFDRIDFDNAGITDTGIDFDRLNNNAPQYVEADAPWADRSHRAPQAPMAQPTERVEPVKRMYTYKVPNEIELTVGDIVILPADGRLKLAKVASLGTSNDLDFNSNYDFNWIVGKVNFDIYNSKMKADRELREHLVTAERQHQKEQHIEKMLSQYPEGSEARRQLQIALANAKGEALAPSAIQPPQLSAVEYAEFMAYKAAKLPQQQLDMGAPPAMASVER